MAHVQRCSRLTSNAYGPYLCKGQSYDLCCCIYFHKHFHFRVILGHSFIPDIYIVPLQETYSEALSVQLRSKRNVLRSLQKEDMFWSSKRSVRGSSFQVEGPITEKALRYLSAERAWGTKSSPRAEERRARREARSETGLQRSVKYDGAQPVTDCQTSAEILYKLRWETGSQCRTSRM